MFIKKKLRTPKNKIATLVELFEFTVHCDVVLSIYFVSLKF